MPSTNLAILACYAIQQAAFLTSLGRDVVLRECDGAEPQRRSAARLLTSLGTTVTVVGAVTAVVQVGHILPHGPQAWTLSASPLLGLGAGVAMLTAWAVCWLCATRETRLALRKTACKLLRAQTGRVSACIALGYAVGMVLVIAVPAILLFMNSTSTDCPDWARESHDKLRPMEAPPGRPNRLPWGMNATNWQDRALVLRGLGKRWMLVAAASAAVAALCGMMMLDIQASVAEFRRDKAVGAAATLGQAIAYISHEARGPLNAAALSLALLEMDLTGDNEPEHVQNSSDSKQPSTEPRLDESVLEDLGTSIQATQRHLDDLLVWQRVAESGRSTLAPDLVPVWSNVSRRVRRETARTFGSLFRSQNVALRATGDGASKQVWVNPADGGHPRLCRTSAALAYVDMSQVMSIVSNGVSNALKHVPADGSASVTVIAAVDVSSAWRQFGPPVSVPPAIVRGSSAQAQQQQLFRGLLRIEVSDTGRGISKALLESGKLFQPFARLRQGDDSLKMASSGLGLAIVRTIAVDSLGGEVGLCSVEGKGTVAFATIPVWCSRPRIGRASATNMDVVEPPPSEVAVTAMVSELASRSVAGGFDPGLEAAVVDSEVSARSDQGDSPTSDPSFIAVGTQRPWMRRRKLVLPQQGVSTSPNAHAGALPGFADATAAPAGTLVQQQPHRVPSPSVGAEARRPVGQPGRLPAKHRSRERSGHSEAPSTPGTTMSSVGSIGVAARTGGHPSPAESSPTAVLARRATVSFRVAGAASGERPRRSPSAAHPGTRTSSPGTRLVLSAKRSPALACQGGGTAPGHRVGRPGASHAAEAPGLPIAAATRAGASTVVPLLDQGAGVMGRGEARILLPSTSSPATAGGEQGRAAKQATRKTRAMRMERRAQRAAERATSAWSQSVPVSSDRASLAAARSSVAPGAALPRASESAAADGSVHSAQRAPSALVTVVEDGMLAESELVATGDEARPPGLCHDERESNRRPGSIASALRAAKAVAQGRPAFVVDDERVNRTLMAALLRRAGMRVHALPAERRLSRRWRGRPPLTERPRCSSWTWPCREWAGLGCSGASSSCESRRRPRAPTRLAASSPSS